MRSMKLLHPFTISSSWCINVKDDKFYIHNSLFLSNDEIMVRFCFKIEIKIKMVDNYICIVGDVVFLKIEIKTMMVNYYIHWIHDSLCDYFETVRKILKLSEIRFNNYEGIIIINSCYNVTVTNVYMIFNIIGHIYFWS